MRRLLNVDFLLVYGIGLVTIAATIVASVEGGAVATIQSFSDALWWSVVTITTVGYGDMVPVTVVGKAVAVVLMLGGIDFFSGVTANLASYLIKNKQTERSDINQLVKEVEEMRQELSKLHSG
jgi:voltage-gated potassium channel